jgi:radical SAM-linked protein
VDRDSGRDRTVIEPRQRWRLTFARTAATAGATHRELAESWIAALAATLPLPRSEGTRPRPALTFAAPLPVGMTAERELADLYVAERLPAWRVREAVCTAAPAGIAIASVHDVWLGAAPLPATVAAADYRIVLTDRVSCTPAQIRDAAGRLLAASTLERRRPRGTDSVAYDLRPLLAAIEVRDTAPTIVLSIRTLFHPERGAGRPEEVLAALGDVLATPLVPAGTVRERVLVADEITDANDAPRGLTLSRS